MKKKINPKQIDQENPEWSKEDVVKARSALEVVPQLFSQETTQRLLKPRGRPRSALPKERINIRLSHEVITHFKADGEGWQTRIDEALRQYIADHPEAR
jgi:uncharacterized protein (DUF4415 family)